MVLVGVLHEVDTIAHLGGEDDAHGASLPTHLLGFCHTIEHLLHIVTILNHNHFPEEALELSLEVAEGHHLVDGGVNLLVVVVDGGDEVVDLLGAGEHHGLPDLAFLELTVTVHGVDEVFVARHLLAEGGTDADAKALTQRATSHTDARQAMLGGGVSLQAGTELTESLQLVDGEIATAGHGAVNHRRDVALRDEKHVLALTAHGEVLGVEIHKVEIHGHKPVGSAERTARMSAFGIGGHSQNVAAHLRRNLLKFLRCFHYFDVLFISV